MANFEVGKRYKFTRVDLGEDVWRIVKCIALPVRNSVGVCIDEISYGWQQQITLSQRPVGEECSCKFETGMVFGVPHQLRAVDGVTVRWDQLDATSIKCNVITDPTFGVFD